MTQDAFIFSSPQPTPAPQAETQQKRKYEFLSPEFRVSSPEELSALENAIHTLEENVRMFGGIIISPTKSMGPVSVLISTLPNGIGIEPTYGNVFTSLMPYREGKAKISLVEQESITIDIEGKLYKVNLREKQKVDGM